MVTNLIPDVLDVIIVTTAPDNNLKAMALGDRPSLLSGYRSASTTQGREDPSVN